MVNCFLHVKTINTQCVLIFIANEKVAAQRQVSIHVVDIADIVIQHAENDICTTVDVVFTSSKVHICLCHVMNSHQVQSCQWGERAPSQVQQFCLNQTGTTNSGPEHVPAGLTPALGIQILEHC